MSDVMLHGVLGLPPKLWRDDPIDVAQRHSRYLQASERIRSDAALIAALQARLAEVERAGRLALDEMRNTVAPRESFTGAVDALDAALSSDAPANPSAL